MTPHLNTPEITLTLARLCKVHLSVAISVGLITLPAQAQQPETIPVIEVEPADTVEKPEEVVVEVAPVVEVETAPVVEVQTAPVAEVEMVPPAGETAEVEALSSVQMDETPQITISAGEEVAPATASEVVLEPRKRRGLFSRKRTPAVNVPTEEIPRSAPVPLITGTNTPDYGSHSAPVSSSSSITQLPTELPTWDNSMFPTELEAETLGVQGVYPLRRTRPAQNVDFRSLTSARLSEYPTEDYDVDVDPYAGLFRPPPAIFRPLVTRDSYFVRQGQVTTDGFYTTGDLLDVSVPWLTRRFDPELAHLKVGPAYFDVLSVGAGVLYSDFDGVQTFREGEGDGWLSYVDLSGRGLVKLTPNVFLTLSGTVIYLPDKNQLGIDLGNNLSLGTGVTPFVRLNFQEHIGTWDFRIYNEFSATLAYLSALADLQGDSDAFQRAGRYAFGFVGGDGRTSDFLFDDDRVFFTNRVGATATTPVRLLRDDWRLTLTADHTDFWRTYDFVDHAYRDRLGAHLGYEGSYLPFSPFVSYDIVSSDGFDTYSNVVYAGGNGRFTENITFSGRAGYIWTEGFVPDREDFLWDVSVTHIINRSTSHTAFAGRSYFTNDFTSDTAVADNYGYSLSHVFNPRLSARLSAIIVESDGLGQSFTGHTEAYGLAFNYRPFDYTSVNFGASYEQQSARGGGFGGPGNETLDRWLYFIRLEQQIASRTTLSGTIQFEDQLEFTEHLYSLGVRRYF